MTARTACIIVGISLCLYGMTSQTALAQADSIYLPGATVNAKALEPFINALQEKRGAVVMAGDSNQLFGGFGWSDGVEAAWTARFPVYATGLLSAAENSGFGSKSGYLYRSLFDSSGVLQAQDALAPFFLNHESEPAARYLVPISFATLGSSTSSSSTKFWGMEPNRNTIQQSPFFALPSAWDLRGHITYRALPQDAGGVLHPMWDVSAVNGIENVVSDAVNVSPTSRGFATTSLDLTYSRATGIDPTRFFRLRTNQIWPQADNLRGPLTLSFYQIERIGASGVSVGTLAGLGGKGFAEFAEGVQIGSMPIDSSVPNSPSPLSIYFSRVRDLMAQPKVLVRLYFGGNDILAIQRSPEETAADALRCMQLLDSLWAQQGWDQSELYFLVVGWHWRPLEKPDVSLDESPDLIELRRLLGNLAMTRPRTAFVDQSVLAPGTEMLANGWWAGVSTGSQTAHLSIEGYKNLSTRELDAMMVRLECTPDFNTDYRVGGSDLGMLLGSWGTVNHALDLTHDGMIDSADLGALIGKWGLCPSAAPKPGASGSLTPTRQRVRFLPHAKHP